MAEDKKHLSEEEKDALIEELKQSNFVLENQILASTKVFNETIGELESKHQEI